MKTPIVILEVWAYAYPGEAIMVTTPTPEADRQSYAAEERLRLVIDTIPVLVVGSLADGSVEWINQRWFEYTGLSLESARGSGWLAAIHPEDLATFEKGWRAAVASGEPFASESRMRRADSKYRLFRIRSAPVHDASGKITNWYIAATDVEHRDSTRTKIQKLKREEDHLRLVVDTTPALIHTGRPDGYLDYFNKRWLDYLGCSLDDVCGWRWTNSIHPEDVEAILHKWRVALASGEPFEAEARVRRADGEYRRLLHRKVPLRDSHGNILKWYGSSLDIEDLKRTECDLRRSEFYLREGQRLTHTGSWMFNPSGSYEYWSRELFEIYGLDPAKGAPTLSEYLACIHPQDRAFMARIIERMLEEASGCDVKKRIVRPDGELRYVRCVGVPVLDNGVLEGVIGTAVDVTEQEQMTQKLQRREMYLAEAQRLSQTGSFGWSVSTGEILWSEETFRIFQYDRTTKPTIELVLQRVHPEDMALVKQTIDGASRDQKDFDVEHRLLMPDDSVKHVHVVAHALSDESGGIEFVGAVTDITQLKRAFDEIRNLRDQLYKENLALKEEIDQSSMFEEIIGSSEALRRVLVHVAKVAPTDSTVLITGETGTGKELVARAIHKRSQRSTRAFVHLDCAAIPPSLVASELFGHEKGAFTGAVQRRLGRFELADGGTLFLDEIGELPAETQVALLRVLQEREFERVGGGHPIPVDVRVLAATNRDLQAAVDAGAFRQDLFYRLNVFPIRLPSLRERAEDIPLLVEYLIERYASKAGKKIKSVKRRTLELFRAYDWPGNIRELQNVVERAVILCDGDTLSVDESWLQHACPRPSVNPASEAPKSLVRLDATRETEIIESALAESRGRVSGPVGAAAKLGIPRSTLESRIQSLGINKHRFRAAYDLYRGGWFASSAQVFASLSPLGCDRAELPHLAFGERTTRDCRALLPLFSNCRNSPPRSLSERPVYSVFWNWHRSCTAVS